LETSNENTSMISIHDHHPGCQVIYFFVFIIRDKSRAEGNT
jgi:hypothetical protein